jgi:hypothetical protein
MADLGPADGGNHSPRAEGGGHKVNPAFPRRFVQLQLIGATLNGFVREGGEIS